MAGIYIHIPFCKQACTYCNFHFSVSTMHKPAMAQAIVREITTTQNFIVDKNIESIYIGGGTPSLLSQAELDLIMQAVHRKFCVASNAEITLEANPDDVTKDKLREWKSAGINRLSVGLQSFNEAELLWMNRGHNATQSLQCILEIQAAGFSNFSVDLIYGSPLQTNKILQQNLETIAQYNVPHVSCYALTVEKKTVLNKWIEEKKTVDIDTEKQAQQFYFLLDWMEKNGYEQYEISSFCKNNLRSKHNSSYWQGKAYYGFGPSAHGYNGCDKRRWNMANNGLYIQAIEKNTIAFEEETLTPTDQLNEYVMTAVRTNNGMELNYILTKYGEEEVARIVQLAKKYITGNKMMQTDTHLILTKEGKFFADGIASGLFK